MPKYQIEFKRAGSSKSYCYFDANKRNLYKEACKAADAKLNQLRLFFRPIFLTNATFKAPKTLIVREWDTDKKCVKRGGLTFKLSLAFLQASFTDGSIERNEWYEYND
jgi:hypothetical protein